MRCWGLRKSGKSVANSIFKKAVNPAAKRAASPAVSQTAKRFKLKPVDVLVLIASLLALSPAHAQTPYGQDTGNVLGLAPVPQSPAAPASSTAAAGNKTAVATQTNATKPTDAQIKSVLSGNITLASFYQQGLITVKGSTVKTFAGSALRAQALQAARLVQRDVKLACGKLCTPGPMPPPTLQEDNILRFDLVISGYEGKLSTVDMANLFNARPIGPGSKVVPVPPAASQPTPLSVNSSTAAATPVAAATAAPASSASAGVAAPP